jgi:hypothetical protein
MNNLYDYLNSIEISTDTLKTKIKDTIEAAKMICPEESKDIFISDWVQTEGKREYEHLFLFTDNYIVESSNFSTDSNINVEATILKERVKYINVVFNKKYREDDPSSRITIFFTTNGGAYELKSAKNNCGKLLEIYKKYIQPNISRTPIPE